MRRLLPSTALLGAVLALAVAAVAPRAQGFAPGEGFAWERVGDVPFNTRSIAFGPDALGRPDAWLWASSNEGVVRLDTAGGFPGAWVGFGTDYGVKHLVALSADTLLGLNAFVLRSTDGGATFEVALDFTNARYFALAAIAPGVPQAGRVLTGVAGGSQFPEGTAYSDDGGTTWGMASMPAWASVWDLAVVPAGGPYAGQVVGTGAWGALYSTDGGRTYFPSSLWGGPYDGYRLAVVEGPGGAARVVMLGHDETAGSGRIWVSDDGGQRWRATAALELGEGAPAGLAGLGGGAAVAVARDGTVYRTDDAGESWRAAGRSPEVEPPQVWVEAMAVGPEGRLYVGLASAGCCERTWMYRTEPLTTMAP